MAITKVTVLMQCSTGGSTNPEQSRVGGWSESWYYQGGISSAEARATATGGLLETRASLLPIRTRIVGQRYQVVDSIPIGQAVSRGRVYPGRAANLTDMPQMSLLWTIQGNTETNTKKYIQRGLPDVFVEEGELKLSRAYKQNLEDYRVALSSFRFRGFDLTAPKREMVSYNATTGACVSAEDHLFEPGDSVRFTTMRAAGGFDKKPYSFTVKVLTAPTGTTFTVKPVPGGGSFVLGNARRVVFVYPIISVSNSSWKRSIIRKVGRPFDQFVGRR